MSGHGRDGAPAERRRWVVLSVAVVLFLPASVRAEAVGRQHGRIVAHACGAPSVGLRHPDEARGCG